MIHYYYCPVFKALSSQQQKNTLWYVEMSPDKDIPSLYLFAIYPVSSLLGLM